MYILNTIETIFLLVVGVIFLLAFSDQILRERNYRKTSMELPRVHILLHRIGWCISINFIITCIDFKGLHGLYSYVLRLFLLNLMTAALLACAGYILIAVLKATYQTVEAPLPRWVVYFCIAFSVLTFGIFPVKAAIQTNSASMWMESVWLFWLAFVEFLMLVVGHSSLFYLRYQIRQHMDVMSVHMSSQTPMRKAGFQRMWRNITVLQIAGTMVLLLAIVFEIIVGVELWSLEEQPVFRAEEYELYPFIYAMMGALGVILWYGFIQKHPLITVVAITKRPSTQIGTSTGTHTRTGSYVGDTRKPTGTHTRTGSNVDEYDEKSSKLDTSSTVP